MPTITCPWTQSRSWGGHAFTLGLDVGRVALLGSLLDARLLGGTHWGHLEQTDNVCMEIEALEPSVLE